MSLQTKAVDRLFERLAATYGAQWTRQWADVPMSDVKSVWGYELASFAGRLDAIAWALENLPNRAPNVIEFRNLCRSAPRPPEALLPEPKADPARVAAELAKLDTVRKQATASRVDHKAWARRLMARHEAGEVLRPIQLRFAREALRLHLVAS